ncbi:helicase associated domain-containing protein [Pseudarthrobacter sp. WHRI 8279]|uniref:helicase associated domain-containing protein n=1 Tax=Pseudarthrobacter sp. WHRI 8279 TaxID=3162566 RepID=UPI0032EBA3BF
MSQPHRHAPYAEWVEMYRRGITSTKIAEVVRTPVTTIRYHLRLARVAEPGLLEEHEAAQKPARRVGQAGRANLAAVVALYEAEQRLPSRKSAAPTERALAAWLRQRRQDNNAGTLAAEYREGLQAVPGWERTRQTKDEARWEARMRSLTEYWAAGNDWPRHKSPDTEEERLLGVWLQYQRTKLAASQLDSDKAERLDKAMPGWRQGRTKRRRQRASLP